MVLDQVLDQGRALLLTDLLLSLFFSQVCVPGDGPPESLVQALQDVLPVVFTLFCFCKRNVSHLR